MNTSLFKFGHLHTQTLLIYKTIQLVTPDNILTISSIDF